MGMRTWTEYGYGFPVFTGSNATNVLEFFKNHEHTFIQAAGPKRHKEFYCALDELEDTAETDGILDEDIIREGLFDKTASAIAMIINRENNLTGFEGFQSDSEYDTPETVMYVKDFPWHFNQKERQTTLDEINGICNMYANELGIPEREIGDKELKYYG